MQIELLEAAQLELDQAIEFYNTERFGLGDEFLTEILGALERIAEHPEAWHGYSKRTRRCQTRRFPYGIVYRISAKVFWLLRLRICIASLGTGKIDSHR